MSRSRIPIRGRSARPAPASAHGQRHESALRANAEGKSALHSSAGPCRQYEVVASGRAWRSRPAAPLADLVQGPPHRDERSGVPGHGALALQQPPIAEAGTAEHDHDRQVSRRASTLVERLKTLACHCPRERVRSPTRSREEPQVDTSRVAVLPLAVGVIWPPSADVQYSCARIRCPTQAV
jgi:hypothetical protein